MAIVVSILFSALRLIDVRSMLLIYISTVAGGVAGGCIAPLTTSIQADNTTYVQYKTGKRAEAAIQVLLPARLPSRRVSIQELSSAY